MLQDENDTPVWTTPALVWLSDQSVIEGEIAPGNNEGASSAASGPT